MFKNNPANILPSIIANEELFKTNKLCMNGDHYWQMKVEMDLTCVCYASSDSEWEQKTWTCEGNIEKSGNIVA
uniref:Uncharacterized protein n=1 Tax=Arion vulgaris TaxID=1028688 RepID=A0A0B6ZJI1_9EUPU